MTIDLRLEHLSVLLSAIAILAVWYQYKKEREDKLDDDLQLKLEQAEVSQEEVQNKAIEKLEMRCESNSRKIEKVGNAIIKHSSKTEEQIRSIHHRLESLERRGDE